MNKKGGFTDLFIFMIVAIIIVFISGMFIFMSGKVETELSTALDGKMFGSANGTTIVNETMGKVETTYNALYWISLMLIVGMAISIFIGSYLVTTRPVFFIPYIFITIIAIIVSVGISNAYGEIIDTPLLASTFEGFIGANFILSKLPIWITVIGIGGGIIMFSKMGSRENETYGGYYG